MSHAVLALLLAAAPAAETGTVAVRADDPDAGVPERFRLPAHEFPFTLTPKYDLPYTGVEVFTVTFPSAVTSPHPANNTVYGEYFRPKGKANLPAMIVLDILDGSQIVSRGEAMWLAQNGIAALTVQMAYYGQRRPAGTKIRLLSPDIDHSVAAITQTVLDVRRATAWLATRPEVDANRLGLIGTSLGSLVGGVAAAAEPKLGTVCLLLSAGGLVDAFYDHPKAGPFRQVNELIGGSKERLKQLIDPVDPLTYADQLKGKRLLYIAASRDEVLPPAAMKKLWEATGKPRLLWVDATHVGAGLYVFPAMAAVVEHVKK